MPTGGRARHLPCVGLVVSGGHTSLFHCESALKLTLLGGTRDDAAGEAFDKVAAILGLGFPGGPAVEREAKLGNPTRLRVPARVHQRRSTRIQLQRTEDGGAVRCGTRRQDSKPPCGNIADLAASFQAAVVDVLCRQVPAGDAEARAQDARGRRRRERRTRGFAIGLRRCAQDEGAELVIPPLALCTDNAAMAALAVEKWRASLFAPADLDAEPQRI